MCGGSFMSGIAPQINSALGGGSNPLQGGGGGGGFFGNAIGGIAPQIGGMGLGGMPAPMQNPFMGGQPPQISSVNTTTTQDIMGRGANYPVGGGMGQPLSRAQLEAAVADDIATGRQIYRGPEGTQIRQKLLQGTPSGANGPYPAQVSTLPVGDIGQVAGSTSQPQTMENMIARARGLIGSQGGGMGQPYISDRGYFGPGTMSNPTGPQYGGQGAVNTQVSRPLTDFPQYGGAMGQPQPPTSRLLQNVQQQRQQQLMQQMQQQQQRRQQKLIQARQPQPEQGLGAGISSLLQRLGR